LTHTVGITSGVAKDGHE